MCEFKVQKNDEIVFRDAVYAKTEGNIVVVKDILGVSKVFESCRIAEVDVNKELLVLTKVE
jgi:predicted RNA-binding protein